MLNYKLIYMSLIPHVITGGEQMTIFGPMEAYTIRKLVPTWPKLGAKSISINPFADNLYSNNRKVCLGRRSINI